MVQDPSLKVTERIGIGFFGLILCPLFIFMGIRFKEMEKKEQQETNND